MKKPCKQLLDCYDMAPLVDLSHDWHLGDNGQPNGKHLVMPAGHSYYRLLRWLSDQFVGKRIVEVGTFRGHGTLCLAGNPATTVRTYDLCPYDAMCDLPPNATRCILLPCQMPLIDDAQCIFYDTSHNGTDEAEFIAHCQAIGWHGPIFWDDISDARPQYEAMRNWWASLEIPKEDWTDVGHCTGTGLTII